MSFDAPPKPEEFELLPVVLQATRAADYSASPTVGDFAPVKASIVVAAQQDGGVPVDANSVPGSDQPQDNENSNDTDSGQPDTQVPSPESINPEASTVDLAPPPGLEVAAEAQAENDARKEDKEAEKDAAEEERAEEKADKEAEKDAAKAEKDAAKIK